MAIIEHAKNLLDFDQKLDIMLLDKVVNLMYIEHGEIVSNFILNSDGNFNSKILVSTIAKTSR